MKTFYGTVIDAGFLARSLCLYRSLAPFLQNKTFGFFCLDDESLDILRALDLDAALVLPVSEIETDALRAIRAERAINEYCWTLKPQIIGYGLNALEEVEWAVYLDSDMMVFADPDIAFAGADPDASSALTPHRPASAHFKRETEISGLFNAGYAAFRNGAEGRRALEWWYHRCLESCPNRPLDGNYADQKYLDRLPDLFTGVHVVPHVGVNAAPWNIEAFAVSRDDGMVTLNGAPLALYHFQGLRIHGERLFELYPGHLKLGPPVVNHIYRPYLRGLRAAFAEIRQVSPGFCKGIEPLVKRPKIALNKLKRMALGLNNMACA